MVKGPTSVLEVWGPRARGSRDQQTKGQAVLKVFLKEEAQSQGHGQCPFG